jgi:O-antigen ligase
LTFSRAAVVGFLAACVVFLPLARWAELISRRVFTGFAVGALALSLAGTPVLVTYLMTRPEAFALRFRILDPALDAFAKRPLWGGGLNNSTALTENSRSVKLLPTGRTEYTSTAVHNYHVILLLDVGIFGYLLYTGFFILICLAALRRLRDATPEMKVLSVGIVSALLGIWVHNMADPFGGHALQAMWWLDAGLAFAISHAIAAQKANALGRPASGRSGRAKPVVFAPGWALSGRRFGAAAGRQDLAPTFLSAGRSGRDQTRPA